jgi:hypothetical protein
MAVFGDGSSEVMAGHSTPRSHGVRNWRGMARPRNLGATGSTEQ